MRRASRRTLLTSIGTSAALSLAGCVGDSNGPGSTDETGTTSAGTGTTSGNSTSETTQTGGSGSVDIRTWIPPADAFEQTDDLSLFHIDLESIRPFRDVFPEGSYEGLLSSLLRRDVDDVVAAEDRQEVLRLNSAPVTLTRTDLDDGQLVESVESAGLEDSGSDGPTTLYEGRVDGAQSTVAVVDGVVVHGVGESATDAVEAVLRARAGDEPRFFEENENVPALYESTGEAHLRLSSTNPNNATSIESVLEGTTAITYGWRFAAEETTFTVGATYPDGEAADPSAFSDHFADNVVPDHYTGFEGRAEGTVVATTGTLPTDEFALYSSDSGGSSETGTEAAARHPPQVQFSFEYDPDAGLVAISHNGGDTMDATRLTATLAGQPTETQFADEHDRFRAGDLITIDVKGAESGTRIRVVWSPENQSGAQVLAEFELP